MTDAEIKEYYADLLIKQYRSKPRARATIEALVELAICNQLPLQVQDAFNLETAIGVQLDVLGNYVGVGRNGYGPDSPISLNDDDFRQLVKIGIIRNYQGSSLYDIQSLLTLYFEDQLFVYDYQTMRLSYVLDENAGSLDLAYMLVQQGLLPKPMGVQLSLIYINTTNPFFGFRTYQSGDYNVSPANTYGTYETDRPFLLYQYAVIV